MEILPIGTRIHTSDSIKHHGNRDGTIVSVYRETNYIEYGVAFHSLRHIDAWFLPKELEQIFIAPLEMEVKFG